MSSVSNLIDGRAIAEQLHQETAVRIEALKGRGVQPGLAFVRVGEDAASQVYVGMKEKVSRRLGIHSTTHVLHHGTTQTELLALVDRLNADPAIHGILVQAPVPSHIDSALVYSSVLPTKDVDGFHPMNVGKVLLGDHTAFLPCTPAGVHELLIRSGVKLPGKSGRGVRLRSSSTRLADATSSLENCVIVSRSLSRSAIAPSLQTSGSGWKGALKGSSGLCKIFG